MTAAAFRPSTIESLKALWVALPLRASNDGDVGDPRERQMQILDTYCFALSEFSSEAIMNTVNNLRAGKIDEASKNFCPKAPELAVFVRAEQKRIDAVKRPKAISYQPIDRPWVDYREVFINKAFADRRKFIEHASLDDWKYRTDRSRYPAGYTWYWPLGPVNTMLGSVYGPTGSARTDADVWGTNRSHIPAMVQITSRSLDAPQYEEREFTQ